MASEHKIFVMVKRYICGEQISVSYGKLSNVMGAIARAESCLRTLACSGTAVFAVIFLCLVSCQNALITTWICPLWRYAKIAVWIMYSKTHVVTLMDDVSQLWTVSFMPDSLITRTAFQPSPVQSVSPEKGVLEMVQVCPPWPHFPFLPRLNKSPDLTLVPASTPCSPRLNTSTARWACSSAKLHAKVCAAVVTEEWESLWIL